MPFRRFAPRLAASYAVFLCILLAAPAPAAAAVEPAVAEFAIRWNASEGGPATADAALVILDMRVKQESHFQVGYYDLPATFAVPAGFSAILRWRGENVEHAELTFKLRGNRALEQWFCPLTNGGSPKAEMDFTFVGADAPARAYSYSCAGTDAARAAAELSAARKACAASVTRREGSRLKVEEWRLPGNVLMIEESGRSANTAKALEHFRAKVVTPLLAAGVRPAADSKTALGSRCP